MQRTFALETLRVLPRIARIARVLRRHGIIHALHGERSLPAPVQVREALEELGTVFMKFGQVLALRRDLLPPAYIAELERLHDHTAALGAGVVQAIIEEEFGRPAAELYASFDGVPLASATIAQVHAATLRNGRRVVVKVQRPDLERALAEDVGALTYLATLAEPLSPQLRLLDPVGLVREFHDSLRREIDFQQEAGNIRRFRAALRDAPNVWIPDVVDDLSTRMVLTLEHSPGMRVDEYARQHPDRTHELADGIAALVLRQVFEDGLFHADPHPGNVFVLPDGRICLHDFGMIGQLPERMREALVELLDAVVRNDPRAVTDAYLALGMVGEDVNRPALESDLADLLESLHGRALAEISVGDAMASLLRIGTRHRIRNPGAMLLLTRAFFITEAVLRGLDPQINVIDIFQREVQRISVRRYAPERLMTASRSLALELERVAREAPGDLRRLLRRAADGNLGQVHAPALEALGHRASRAVERLTGGVASAALIVGGGILVEFGGWHRLLGDLMLLVGLVGICLVALGALRARR